MSDYPTEIELKMIENWDAFEEKDYLNLMAYVRSIWWMPDWGFKQDGARFELHTGGWSGNESIISAMERNSVFWLLYWESTTRGGHYVFESIDEFIDRAKMASLRENQVKQ